MSLFPPSRVDALQTPPTQKVLTNSVSAQQLKQGCLIAKNLQAALRVPVQKSYGGAKRHFWAYARRISRL